MNEFQNWNKGQRFQDYFDFIVLISEIRNEGQLIQFNLTIFDSIEQNFFQEVQFTNSQIKYPNNFTNFSNLLKQINLFLFDAISSEQKTFILCTYGKDLLLKFIPTLSIQNDLRPQQYFLQFIDLRHELFNFMMDYSPQFLHNLNGEFENLLNLMIGYFKIEKSNCCQQIYKQILLKLLQNNHKFGNPVIIDPSKIYGLKLYERDPWYNQLPIQQQNVVVQTFYAKIRGIPFQCSKQDLINFLKIQSLTQQNIVMKYSPNGQFSGESFARIQSLKDFEDLKKLNRTQMEHRYLEILNSNFDEFQEASSTEKFLQKQSSKVQSSDYLSLTMDGDQKQQGVLKLRGLPWSCTKEDIQVFLQNSSKIKKIKLLYDNNGKPIGQCYVVVKNCEIAEKMKQQYHKKSLGQRYIEVFTCSQKEYNNYVSSQKRSRSRSTSR